MRPDIIPAVMFDLDETLFNRAASLRTFVQHQFSGREIGGFQDLQALGARFLELDRRGRVSKLEVYRRLIAEINCTQENLAKDLFDDYEANAWRYARPFEGVGDTLLWLKKSGRGIAIVSNGQTHIQLRSLLALNLDRLADVYLISEQEGCRKPDVRIFLRAADKLSVKASDCVFVGDSPEADLLGARSAGMRTIWFPNGAEWPTEYSWNPDATISCLAEVRVCIEQWEES